MKSRAMYRLIFSAVAVGVVYFASAPLRAAESDDQIVPAFKETYVYKTYLMEDSITVEARDGVVTLTGTVADESRKMLAQESLASLPWVTRVENRLTTEAEVAAESADAWLDSKVKLALMFHRHVNAGKTNVEVRDGIVTLTGEAANLAQKELTAEYVRDIEGVHGVKNEMTLAAVPEIPERTENEIIDDASVTALVKTALMGRRSTRAVNTKVVTRNGVVTLTGTARNAAEKNLVSALVGDIHGVTRVMNEMTVAEPETMQGNGSPPAGAMTD